jgi:hypothetical protein
LVVKRRLISLWLCWLSHRRHFIST